jgi:alkylation response protein AidB-like acyl-CoA dehydrogenase
MFSPSQEAFRTQVRALLSDSQIRALIQAAGEPDSDPRPLYRRLGDAGLLAVNWPVEFGGLGMGQADAAIVVEEMGQAGVPDTLHLLSIQVVGSLLMMAGSDQQKRALARSMAQGEIYACVLYTEPEAGTDLSAIRTHARRSANGDYIVSGRKVFNLKTRYADYGLCLARTEDTRSPLQGLTLFMLPLRQPGVEIEILPTLSDEKFHEVRLENARVGADLVIGEPGRAWALMLAALSFERTGADYFVRARRWLRHLAGTVSRESASPDVLAAIGVASAELEASRLVAWEVLGRLEDGNPDDTLSAIAKLYASELAQRIAWLGADLGIGVASEAGAMFGSAYREAPGLTISAGASEVMLETIARSTMVRPERRTNR